MRQGFTVIGAIVITAMCVAIAGAFNLPLFNQGSPGQPAGPYGADQLSQQSAIMEQQRKAVELQQRRIQAINEANTKLRSDVADAFNRLQQDHMRTPPNTPDGFKASQQYNQRIMELQQQHQRAIQDANMAR